MTRVRALFLLCCGLLLALGGCAGKSGYFGLSGQTTISGGLPKLAINAEPSLAVKGNGLTWGTLQTDTNLKPTSKFYYTVYGQKDAQPGSLAQRHAHVVMARIDNPSSWEFTVESFTRRNEVYLRDAKINGLDWTEHLLFENSQGDWFSDLWLANGYKVPEVWVGKRWSRTYFGSTRMVVEYREPMPDCVDISDTSGSSYIVSALLNTNSQQCERLLKEFNARADQAFDIQSSRGQEFDGEAPAGVLLKRPERTPDMTRLVGKGQPRSGGDRDFDWD